MYHSLRQVKSRDIYLRSPQFQALDYWSLDRRSEMTSSFIEVTSALSSFISVLFMIQSILASILASNLTRVDFRVADLLIFCPILSRFCISFSILVSISCFSLTLCACMSLTLFSIFLCLSSAPLLSLPSPSPSLPPASLPLPSLPSLPSLPVSLIARTNSPTIFPIWHPASVLLSTVSLQSLTCSPENPPIAPSRLVLNLGQFCNWGGRELLAMDNQDIQARISWRSWMGWLSRDFSWESQDWMCCWCWDYWVRWLWRVEVVSRMVWRYGGVSYFSFLGWGGYCQVLSFFVVCEYFLSMFFIQWLWDYLISLMFSFSASFQHYSYNILCAENCLSLTSIPLRLLNPILVLDLVTGANFFSSPSQYYLSLVRCFLVREISYCDLLSLSLKSTCFYSSSRINY